MLCNLFPGLTNWSGDVILYAILFPFNTAHSCLKDHFRHLLKRIKNHRVVRQVNCIPLTKPHDLLLSTCLFITSADIQTENIPENL